MVKNKNGRRKLFRAHLNAMERHRSSTITTTKALTAFVVLLACVEKEALLCEASSLSPTARRLRRVGVSVGLGVLSGFLVAALVGLVFRFFFRYISRTPILKGPVIFSPKIHPNTLNSALSSQNHLLGSSPNGDYFKTILDNGLIVAVKRLNPISEHKPNPKSLKRKIQHELEILSKARDRNVMSLRAYVCERDRFSLVYDHMPCGSLREAMSRVRDGELELGWEARLRIAVGVIKGLHYLHSLAPQILHRNLKPSNVLLDAEFEPRLTDYALPIPTPNLDRPTSPYDAPETLQPGMYSEKSDIFSFGMILGELLTGRERCEGGMGPWLSQLQQAGEGRKALDKSILREREQEREGEGEEEEEDGEEDEMLMALRIAVVCLSDQPPHRPSSDELVHMLTQLHSF